MTEAHSRASDPSTSHDAAHDVEAAGIARRQRLLCLDEVLRHPGATAAEIAVAVGLERHAPSRRLPELRDAGLVTNGAPRKCKVTASASLTWYPRSGAPTHTPEQRPKPKGREVQRSLF